MLGILSLSGVTCILDYVFIPITLAIATDGYGYYWSFTTRGRHCSDCLSQVFFMENPPSPLVEAQIEDIELELVLQLQLLIKVSLSTYTLLGHFLSTKVLNKNAIQLMIPRFWNFRGLVVTSYLRPNTYSISIASKKCYTKIWDKSP